MRTIQIAAVLIGLMMLSVDPVVGQNYKPLPPPATKPISDKDRSELEAGATALAQQIEQLHSELRDRPKLLALLADVQIYLNAVRYPLKYNEPTDAAKAKAALAAGMQRARDLREGNMPWTVAAGPRGYVSKIDGSVQPYLLAPPKDFKPGDGKKYPVLIFCHGRGEDLMELKFINGRAAPGSADKPHIDGAFFVQPYGRYCCANKFAGEIDVLEVLDSLRKQYPIDDDRIVLTGFSMGGAAVWHLAVHYADRWCAASPGAGFCETKIYQNLAAKGELATTPWYEQALWHWYDAPDYVMNLANVPLISYAGTEDPQQQSGTIMEKAAKEAGVPFARIWGQGVGHKYEPKALGELNQRLGEYAAKGRNAVPNELTLETQTLRYNRMFWLTVDSLDRHWQRAEVKATLGQDKIEFKISNVSRFTFDFPTLVRERKRIDYGIVINGEDAGSVVIPAVVGVEPRPMSFQKTSLGWRGTRGDEDQALRKRHGLQGPIDDAFLDKFLMVRPTGKPLNERIGTWANSEMERAILQWHRIFRGEVTVRDDTDIMRAVVHASAKPGPEHIGDAELAANNLVLWGDPSTNKVLEYISSKLPIKWDAKQVTLGSRTFDSATHVPILIYPNPLNPTKYVVINSGFTFREDANSTNSRQVPKLPDYAIVDVTTPPNGHSPGKIVAAGFFGEKWELREDDGKMTP
jgi:pimeloyl-ACP methyl ester carboxylesterase